jgi:hypothetical protein
LRGLLRVVPSFFTRKGSEYMLSNTAEDIGTMASEDLFENMAEDSIKVDTEEAVPEVVTEKTELTETATQDVAPVRESKKEKATTTQIKVSALDRAKERGLRILQNNTVDKLFKKQNITPTDSEDDDYEELDVVALFASDGNEKEDETLSRIKTRAYNESIDADGLTADLLPIVREELIEEVRADVQDEWSEAFKNRCAAYEKSQEVPVPVFQQIQMWLLFPVVGTVIFFIMCMAIAFERKNKYPVNLKNWAKAQIRFAWVYVIATAIVLFVVYWAGVSFIEVIHRGLRA